MTEFEKLRNLWYESIKDNEPTKLTEQEKDKYIDWYLQECCNQADELSWLLDNLNDEATETIKDTVRNYG